MQDSQLMNEDDIMTEVMDAEALEAAYADDGLLVEAEKLDARAEELIALTARLAQIMAQEADLLEAMQVSKIEALQAEKTRLANALQDMRRQLAYTPDFIQHINEDLRHDLVQVVKLFNMICEENYHRLMVARAVNQDIVAAIAEVTKEQSAKDSYDKHGVSHKDVTDALSVTLNQKI